MFENIIVRDSSDGERAIDIGLIAETLLFYDNVHILIHRGALFELLKAVPADALIRALDSKAFTMTYVRSALACMTNTNNGVSTHSFQSILIGGKNKKMPSASEDLDELITRALGSDRHSRRVTNKLMDRISTKTDIGKVKPEEILRATQVEIENEESLRRSVEASLATLVPNFKLAAHWRFRAIKLDAESYFIDSDLDFTAINHEYHKSISPSHSTISEAFLLAGLLEAIADLQVGAEYLAEMATNRKSSSILQRRSERILRKHAHSLADIAAFQEMELGEANAIRDALNSGERTFADFLNVLEKGDRFKKWLKGQNPHERLTVEYYKAATAETWIEKLPAKVLRWAIFSALGFAASHGLSGEAALATELGISAGDALVLDKILKGWKPNQFIEGPLKKFVSG